MTATVCAQFQLLTLAEQDRLLNQIRDTLYPPADQPPTPPEPIRLQPLPQPDHRFRPARCSSQVN